MYAIHINRNIILQLLTTCYARGRINVPATRHLDLCSNTIGYIDKIFGELFRVNVLPHVIYAQNTVRPHVLIDYDKIIALSYLIQITIRIQTTSEGGLSEFAFNLNRVNANSMWMQLMQIDSHSMHIIFVM